MSKRTHLAMFWSGKPHGSAPYGTCAKGFSLSHPHPQVCLATHATPLHPPLACICSAFYKKFVRPRVVAYFSAELEATEHFFYLAGVLPWAPGMTSATIGYTLWNRQHKDDDLALTVLEG